MRQFSSKLLEYENASLIVFMQQIFFFAVFQEKIPILRKCRFPKRNFNEVEVS